MAAEAVIVFKNDIDSGDIRPFAVKNIFSKVWYTPAGMVTRFSYISAEGSQQSEQEYISEIIAKQGGKKEIFYYNKDDYREFLNKKIDISEVKRFRDVDFTPAQINDIVEIWPRFLDLNPTLPTFSRKPIYWNFSGQEIKYDEINGIELPANAEDGIEDFDILTDEAKIFFETHSLRLKNGQLDIEENEKSKCFALIANISQQIQNIGVEIYELYDSENPDISLTVENIFGNTSPGQDLDTIKKVLTKQLETYKGLPLAEVYHLNTYNEFYTYYLNLDKYYNDILNKLSIVENDDIEKALGVLLGFHSNILFKIDVKRRLEILEHLVKNKLSLWRGGKIDSLINSMLFLNPVTFSLTPFLPTPKEDVTVYENLAVKLCMAFSSEHLSIYPGQTIKSHIDVFLEGLLKSTVKSETVTLYESLYERMSTSWNVTEIFISLSNWIFDTKFNPTDTKGAFVRSIYVLWEASRYSPFEEVNGEIIIRQKSLGIKMLDTNPSTSLAYFTNPNDANNQNCLFYYTNEVGYESFQKTHSINGNTLTLYRDKWLDASPMVLPYESEKRIGIYFDNFRFNFKGDQIISEIKKAKKISDYEYDSETNTYLEPTKNNLDYVFYGKYNLYQPIALTNVNIDTKVPLLTTTVESGNFNGTQVNTFTPIFVLKYIDDVGDRSDAETILGYAVDMGLTFSGIGNLAKLRHLRWIATGAETFGLFTRNGLKIIIGGVDFTSGALGFFANFVNCGANDTFCQRTKEFITLMQIAAGGVTIGDTIASLALKRKAAQVIAEAGGGANEAAIKTNLKTKLNNYNPDGAPPQAIDDAADAIAKSGKDEYLESLSILLKRVNKIYDEIQPNVVKRVNASDGAYSKSYFNQRFNETNFKIIIQDFLESGVSDNKTIEEFIILACRADKKLTNAAGVKVRTIKGYTFEEARIIIKYNEVVRNRGFVTGFHSLADYQLFSQKAKIYLDNFCDKWKIKNQRYEVQGSVQFKSHLLDPDVNNIPVLRRDGNIVTPDDFDGRIFMSKQQAYTYLREIKKHYTKQVKLENPSFDINKINRKVDEIVIEVEKGIKKGMIYKADILPPEFLDGLQQAVKRSDGTDIFYPLNNKVPPYSEVGFSIIIKGSPMDIDPVMSLKY